MKIAYLLTQSLESPSGLGRYWPLAKEIAARGHDVEIYALHPNIESLENKDYQINGVKVHYVAPMHVKKDKLTKSYYSPAGLIGVTTWAAWQLTGSALRSQADILHVGKPHPMNSLAGLFGKWFNGKRLFLDCDDYEAASGNFSSGWQKFGIEFFEQRTPHRAETITTNTFFMQQKLLSWDVPEKRIVYLPNGVDRERFAQPHLDVIESLRAELELDGKNVISYIGSLSLASHGVDLLLEAFKTLKLSQPNSILLLVGGGEDYQSLRSSTRTMGLENDVRFTGRIPPDKIPLYYRLSQVSVDPVYDNDAARGRSPLKLFESWASGTPFVTADVGDRRQLIGDPPTGLLTEPGDPDSLAQTLERLLSDADLQKTLSRRGLERVKAYYWDHLASNMERVYLTGRIAQPVSGK